MYLFRNRNTVSVRQLTSPFLACSTLLVFFGLAAHKTHGFIGRLYDQPITASDHYIAYNRRNHIYRSDTYAGDDSMKLLFVGASFGRDVVNILRETYDLTAVELVYRDDLLACDFASRVGSGDKDIQRRLFDVADLVLFASNYDVSQLSCIHALINRASGTGIPLYRLGKKQFGHNLNWVVRVPQQRWPNLGTSHYQALLWKMNRPHKPSLRRIIFR